MQAGAVQRVLVSCQLVAPGLPYIDGRPGDGQEDPAGGGGQRVFDSGYRPYSCPQGYARNGRALCFAGVSRHLDPVRPPLVHDARHAAPACAGRVHRDVYGAGVGRAISIGHVKSAGQWCEMLRATRSARASVIVCPDSSRAKKAPWFARCRPAVDRLMPRCAA